MEKRTEENWKDKQVREGERAKRERGRKKGRKGSCVWRREGPNGEKDKRHTGRVSEGGGTKEKEKKAGKKDTVWDRRKRKRGINEENKEEKSVKVRETGPYSVVYHRLLMKQRKKERNDGGENRREKEKERRGKGVERKEGRKGQCFNEEEKRQMVRKTRDKPGEWVRGEKKEEEMEKKARKKEK